MRAPKWRPSVCEAISYESKHLNMVRDPTSPTMGADAGCVRPVDHAVPVEALRDAVRDNEELAVLASLFEATGNATRLRILYLLWREPELCVCELADVLGVTAQAVSQQLKRLRASGLVTSRRSAQTIFYRLEREQEFMHILIRMLEGRTLQVAA